jgi:hypothetical protein
MNYSFHVAIPCKYRLWVGATLGITKAIIEAHTQAKSADLNMKKILTVRPTLNKRQPLWELPFAHASGFT